MRKLTILAAIAGMMMVTNAARAAYYASDSFETAWSGSYASGWENVEYTWGTASTPQMTQYSSVVTANGNTVTAADGSYFAGLKITAAGSPESSTNWWGGVTPTFVSESNLAREYKPWMSVQFYDDDSTSAGLQLSCVPDSGIADDWTDIQFGERYGTTRAEHYWFSEAKDADWVETSVARSVGWHTLKLAENETGSITYSIDGTDIGSTVYSSYLDLSTPWLQVQFTAGGFATSEVYVDNFQVGSTVPEPGTMALLAAGLVGLLAYAWRKRG